MTKQQSTEWLEYRAKVTGKTVHQIRQEMRERGSLSDKSNAGFTNPEVAKRASKKGAEARKAKRELREN